MLSYDHEYENTSMRSGGMSGRKTSIILQYKTYSNINKNNAIKLLLRSKKLYQAMSDIRKLLEMMLI
jgi:hypothetical protein